MSLAGELVTTLSCLAPTPVSFILRRRCATRPCRPVHGYTGFVASQTIDNPPYTIRGRARNRRVQPIAHLTLRASLSCHMALLPACHVARQVLYTSRRPRWPPETGSHPRRAAFSGAVKVKTIQPDIFGIVLHAPILVSDMA